MKKMKGIYKAEELSNTEYHAEKDHISSSNVKDIIAEKSKFGAKLYGLEKFYQEKVLGIRENVSKPAFTEGSLVHSMILEPHLTDEEFVMYDGFRKAGKAWEEFKANEVANKNRTILSKPQYKRCENLVEGYKRNKTAVSITESCDTELSLFTTINGVKVKVRADAIDVENGVIMDVKTTAYEADYESFRNTVEDFSYDLSAALYAMAFEKHYGKPFRFLWVVISKKDFACEIYELSDESREKGLKSINKAFKVLKECRKTGKYENKKSEVLVKKYYNDEYEIKKI